jgi:predicted TIM-barrel fold metal-dependent hydrolase
MTGSDGRALAKIISVDDHVVEPPDLWTARLVQKFQAEAPRVVREKVGIASQNGAAPDGHDGEWADVWHFGKLAVPILAEYASAGVPKQQLASTPLTLDALAPGFWQQDARLVDMTRNHVEASVCFPNTLPGSCGQTFSEVEDKELGLACIQAYNDWVIDDWCGGAGSGRLFPVAVIPLWDPELAAAEVRRCAGKGCPAVSYSENTYAVGFDTVHSGRWDPFFAACAETQSTVCVHLGSSSIPYTDDPDALPATGATLNFQFGMHSLIDIVLSGVLERFAGLTVAYPECNVAWMPYVLQRMDMLWERRQDNARRRINLRELPSSYVRGQVFGCVLDDVVGIRTQDHGIGLDRITLEVNYPRANANYPGAAERAAQICAEAQLNDDQAYGLLRGNAIKAFGLQRFGLTS